MLVQVCDGTRALAGLRFDPNERMKCIIVLLLVGLSAASVADPKRPAPRRIEISLTARGFEPNNVKVAAKQAVTFVITRKTERTCAKVVVIDLGNGSKIERELPIDNAVEIPVTFAKKGELSYACSMDMVRGIIIVQ